MIELVKDSDKDIQIIAVATLRHLSPNGRIKDDFTESGMIQSVIRCISWANEDMRQQIAGLIANLSEHRECQSTLLSAGIIQAIDDLSSLEHEEIWQVNVLCLVELLSLNMIGYFHLPVTHPPKSFLHFFSNPGRFARVH